MEDFLWGLKINDDLTMSLIGKTTVVGLGIATIGFLCNVAYNMWCHQAIIQLNERYQLPPDGRRR